MKYQFRPYAKMQPTIVTLTGKVYEKLEHPLYKEYKIIEVVDEEGEIYYAFEDELKLDELEQQYKQDEFAIGFGEYLDSLTADDMGILSIKELLEIYKKTL